MNEIKGLISVPLSFHLLPFMTANVSVGAFKMPRCRAYIPERIRVLGGQEKDRTVQKRDRTEKMSAGITVSLDGKAEKAFHFEAQRFPGGNF